jgi:hypothetical protein
MGRQCTNHPCHSAANSANNTAQGCNSVPLWTEGWWWIAGGVVIFDCGQRSVVVYVVFYQYLWCFRCYGT